MTANLHIYNRTIQNQQFRVDMYDNGQTIYSKYIHFFLQIIWQL